jgi:hypothetical protein
VYKKILNFKKVQKKSHLKEKIYLRGMKNLLIFGLLVLLCACKKTPITEASDELVGNWIHYTDEDDSHLIKINEDGSGNMEWRVDGKLSVATKTRDWYLDDNVLSFGKATFNGESYPIDKYPTFEWDEVIKYYDTIPELSYYMILDGLYYVRK